MIASKFTVPQSRSFQVKENTKIARRKSVIKQKKERRKHTGKLQI